MEIKRKYIIQTSQSGEIIEECPTLSEAKRNLNSYLIKDYEEFLKNAEENGEEFQTYWQWYYTKENGCFNGKFYEIKVI